MLSVMKIGAVALLLSCFLFGCAESVDTVGGDIPPGDSASKDSNADTSGGGGDSSTGTDSGSTDKDTGADPDTGDPDTGSDDTGDFPDFGGTSSDAGGFDGGTPPPPADGGGTGGDGSASGGCAVDTDCTSPFNCCQAGKCGFKIGTTCIAL